jgi:hypothetical protein
MASLKCLRRCVEISAIFTEAESAAEKGGSSVSMTQAIVVLVDTEQTLLYKYVLVIAQILLS